MNRTFRLLAVCAFSLAALPARPEGAVPSAGPSAGPAAAKDAAKDALTEKEERKFREWESSLFKFMYPVKGKEDVLVLPNYLAECPNSRNLSRQAMFAQLTDVQEVEIEVYRDSDGNYNYGDSRTKAKKEVFPTKEDVEAACALRSLEAGDYGEVLSVRVVKILGKDEMLVDQLQLYERAAAVWGDAWREGTVSWRKGSGVSKRTERGNNARVTKLWQEVRDNQEQLQRDGQNNAKVLRMVGFPTLGLREGDAWKGPAGKRFKVIVGGSTIQPVETPWGVRKVAAVALVNPALVGKSIEKKEFEGVLARWGVTRKECLDVCETAAGENPVAAKAKVVALRQLSILGDRHRAGSQKVSAPAGHPPAPAQGPVAGGPASPPPSQGARPGQVVVRPPAPAPPKPAPSQPVPKPVASQEPPPAPPGSPIFRVDDSPPKPEASAPSAPVPAPAPAAPGYTVVPPNAQVDALVDLKSREVLGKLIVGRWQAKDPAKAPFYRVCAPDGTYREFDANDRATGAGEYRVTSKGAVVFIGEGKNDLTQLSFTSPNALGEDGAVVCQRVVPSK